jgi:TetR/AcrR family transcriptional regulator, cholesterol catabolism regulator
MSKGPYTYDFERFLPNVWSKVAGVEHTVIAAAPLPTPHTCEPWELGKVEGERMSTPRAKEIIAAAAKLFKEKGYHATTIQDVADEVGMLKGSLYYHIKSKEELLYLVTKEPIRELIERQKRLMESDLTPQQKIIEFTRSHLQAFDANYPHMFVFLQEKASLSEPVQAEVAGIDFRYEALLEAILHQGVDGRQFRQELDLKIMAFSILGMCNWMFKWYYKGGRLTIDEIAHSMAEIVLNGITTRTL